MSLFLIAALALTGITLLMLLRPWQDHRTGHEATAREINTRIYRDQLAELDRDLKAGTLAPADHAQARSELQRRLLDDTAAAEPAVAQARRSHRTALALAAALPMVAAGLYAALGTPAALSPQAASQAAGADHGVTMQQVEEMVSALAARLEKNPGDTKGWSMLARSYRVMSRFPEAAQAFARIPEAELKRDPVLLAEYADTLATVSNGNLEGRPLQMVMTALKIDPDHAMSLSLAATAAYERKDFKTAGQYWQRLLKLLPPDSEDAQFLVKTLAEIGPPVTASTVRAAPAPGAASVSGKVTLSPSLAAKAGPNDTVFVFARAEGSRMPLAVQRARVADLPLAFKLDDSMAISPAAKLSDAAQVLIEARVSKTGSATPAAGDLVSASASVKVGAGDVGVVVDQVRN